MPGEHACMHGNPGPRNPLHIGHRRAAIDVRVVQPALLNDAEDPHRGRVTGHARRDRGFREQSVGIIDPQMLLLDRNGNDQRAVRLGICLRRIRQFRMAGRRTAAEPPAQDRAPRRCCDLLVDGWRRGRRFRPFDRLVRPHRRMCQARIADQRNRDADRDHRCLHAPKRRGRPARRNRLSPVATHALTPSHDR